MAGVSVDSGGKGGRRSLDSEINMIPMIDLLVCCISFLLLTAVWSHMARVNADAQVPGPPSTDQVEPQTPEKMLHVTMVTTSDDEKFVLEWRSGKTSVEAPIDVPRPHADRVAPGTCPAEPVRFTDLAKKIEAEWTARGTYRGDAPKRDQAVLHTDNKVPFCDLIAVIDAIYQPKREYPGAKKPVPAFNVTFSVN